MWKHRASAVLVCHNEAAREVLLHALFASGHHADITVALSERPWERDDAARHCSGYVDRGLTQVDRAECTERSTDSLSAADGVLMAPASKSRAISTT
eukprot:6173018-Pleurochrysis_carterae.AAC.1